MTPRLSSLLVPSFVQRRYTAKFVVSILFVLLAIGVVGYVGYAQVNQTITEDTQQNLESSATMQADALSEWTRNMEYQTRLVGQLPGVGQGSAGSANARIAAYASTLNGYSAIHVVDLENDTVLTTTTQGVGSIEPGQPLSEVQEPWGSANLQEAVRGDRLWISDGSYNSTAVPGTQVIAFAAQTSNGDRAVVVAASIDIRVNQLHQAGTNQTTTIVNGEGEQVLRHTASGHAGAHTHYDDGTHLQRIQAALEEDSVQFLVQNGTLYAYAPVDGPANADDWVAVTSAPASDAYAVRNTVGMNVLLIIASGVITLGIMGFVLGRQTVTPLKRLRERARAMEEGDLDVNLETRRKDEIGQLYRAFDSMRLSLREQIQEAQAARDEAEAERERIQRINRELEATADEYSEVMQVAADGDLTARMDTGAENEAMGSIATEFNEMLGEIEQTVEELNAFAAEVATASEEVTASSEEVRSASEQISESVQEISSGAENQNESLQSVNQEMSDLSTTTEEIAASSNEVADIAERTADTGEDGQEAAQAAIEGMEEIEAESSAAVEEISQLEEEVAQIDELVERIQEIADQTNMLALNANIEASRSTSGEGDGGFGVVAQEVKELSQDAKNAAEEVEQRLVSIREQTRRSAEEVEQTSEDVDEASRHVQATVDALAEIAEYAKETNTGVQEISAATEQQAASTQEVVAMVDEAATISEETTAEAESVAAAAEEQTTALTEVSRSASDLSEQAARLSEALDRFDTDADVEGGPETRMLEGAALDEGDLPGGPGDDGGSEDDAGEDDQVGTGPVEEALQASGDGGPGGAEADPTAAGDAGVDPAGDAGADPAGDVAEPAEEAADPTAEPADDEARAAGDDAEPASGEAEPPAGDAEPGGDLDAGLEDIDAFQPGVDAADFGADTSASQGATESAADAGEEPDAAADGAAEAEPAEPAPDGDADAGETDRTGSDVFDFGPDELEDPYDTPQTGSDGLTAIDGVGQTTAEALRAAGFETVDDLRAASHEELARTDGVGEVAATQIKDEVGDA